MAVTLPQLRQHLNQTKQFGADERTVLDKLIQYLEAQAASQGTIDLVLDGTDIKVSIDGVAQGTGVPQDGV